MSDARSVGRYPIDESLVLGLDLGIASIGSAIVRHGEDGSEILFAGSRCFEPPEEPKTKKLKNAKRRASRLQRRVTKRRRQRMAAVRDLLAQHNLLEATDPSVFHHRAGAPDPWTARADGLDRRLTDEELAAALIHIAKHRGFKSNRKSERGQNAPDEAQRMLGAIARNQERAQRWRTVGEMVARDPEFADRRRNRSGEYTHTLARDDLHAEARRLFADQRRFRHPKASEGLEAAYLEIAFHQRPLQDSEWMVGECPFEPGEKRAAMAAPSFEKFRLLAKLNTVKVREADGSLRRLSREELHKAVDDLGAQATLSWNALGKKVGLAAGATFDGIDEKKAKRDVAASRGCMRGTAALRNALGRAGWNAMRGAPDKLDAIAAVLAFREDLGRIEAGLAELSLEPLISEAIMDAARDGAFADFSKAGHLSANAARAIVPHLLEGKVYSEACTGAGYDHAKARRVEIADIRNPVVRRALREARKQAETLIHEFGARPGRIVVELAREVGKSAIERGEITRGIERRTSEKERHRVELKETRNMDREPSDEDLRRYELWKEQSYRCIYSDKPIPPDDILATSNSVQVDHVLPRSRSQDNSYANQVLCFAGENQDKGQRTPWEWKMRDEEDEAWWTAFEARVRAMNVKWHKKKLLLMRDFDERQQGFVERNLNDTKYATRALLSSLGDLYPGEPDPSGDGYLRDPKRRLFARPGAVTAMLRRAWGVGKLKDRADDRHHGLDALICAATPQEWLLNRLTREYQRQEEENRKEWTPKVPPPWPTFREDAIAAYDAIFVSRSERGRARGQGHRDTIYQVEWEDGEKVTYERKAIADLTKGDLDRLKDPASNGPLREALEAWMARGKPIDNPPRYPPNSPNGNTIRKVRLWRKGTAGFALNGGHVDNSDMVRVDVFGKDGKFYLVPIYRHQIMNREKWPEPPRRAIRAYKREEEWEPIDESFTFRFSLHPDSYIEVAKRDGEVLEGYFRGADRSTGAISISPHNLRDTVVRGIGAKTLKDLRKHHVDRLGRKHEIEREQRTWHGAVCT